MDKQELSKTAIAQYLVDRGWSQWFHVNYWVHRETVEDPESQDYTDYGMPLEDAYKYELLGRPKIKSLGVPVAGMFDIWRRTGGFTHSPRDER